MTAKTTYFGDATLLLAGGGSHAAAFAGALLAAQAYGCRFHAVVATSTGAIVAALFAAGYRGQELIKTLRAISRVECASNRLSPSHPNNDSSGTTLLPLDEIQHRLEEKLRAKLRLNRAATFADLPQPLVILAADLQRGISRVWSRATEPATSVAFAARCACADPFRFGVAGSSGPFFAGEIVLESPSIFDVDAEHLEDSACLPALLLHGSTLPLGVPRGPGDSDHFFRGADVGVALRPPDFHFASGVAYQAIEMRTATLPKDKVSAGAAFRHASRTGFQAVEKFFANETPAVIASGYISRRLASGNHADLVDQIAIAIRSARNSIFIAGGDLSWADDLLPLLAHKSLSGVSIRILNTKPIAPDLPAILGAIGCENRRIATDLLTYGVFVDGDALDSSAILINLMGGRLRGGTLLREFDVPGVVPALLQRLEMIWEAATPQNVVTHRDFNIVPWSSITAALRDNVENYRDATFAQGVVEVKDLSPLASYLHVARLRRAAALVELYCFAEQPLFLPLQLRGASWFLPPPVIEIVDGRMVVVDGEHRIAHCRRHGVPTIQATIVQHAGPLPAIVDRNWDAIFPVPHALTREQRYVGYEPSRWRDLRSAWAAVIHQSFPDAPSVQAVRYPSTLPQS